MTFQVRHDVGLGNAAVLAAAYHDGRVEIVLIEESADRRAQLV
jgi:hypothetical protein